MGGPRLGHGRGRVGGGGSPAPPPPPPPSPPPDSPQGDNNWGDDRALYSKGQQWLANDHVLGRVVGFLPHVGRVTIIMNDYPVVKYALIGVLGLFVVTSKE